MNLRTASALGGLLFALVPAARAHEVRPAYLELRETSAGVFDVLFKTPTLSGLRLNLRAVLPAGCRTLIPVATYETPAAVLERWTVACSEPLAGHTIAVPGLSGLLLETLVRIETLDGRTIVERLKPTAPSFVVPVEPTAGRVARAYLGLGIEHILGGIDHLLFVLALLLIVEGPWLLLKTITAFTIAHSITLALATLGVVHLAGPPVEATIALSVVFVAAELARTRQGDPGLTARAPWIVAFTFGLLHGLGFAGALAQVGLPERQIPVALLLFNVGVETGQLLFVAAVLTLAAVARRLAIPQPLWAWRVPAYGIGAIAAFWTVERVAGFWP